MGATLRGNGLELRPVSDADLPALVEILSDPRVSAWWGPYDEERLRAELAEPEVLGWAIVVDGELSGLVEATEEREDNYRHVDLDVFLDPDVHGRGLGAEALRTALRHLFRERGHHRATIMPVTENERAIRSYERVGFKRVGVLRQAERAADGRWRDGLLMDLLAGELE